MRWAPVTGSIPMWYGAIAEFPHLHSTLPTTGDPENKTLAGFLPQRSQGLRIVSDVITLFLLLLTATTQAEMPHILPTKWYVQAA
jgi:hypothetical protein